MSTERLRTVGALLVMLTCAVAVATASGSTEGTVTPAQEIRLRGWIPWSPAAVSDNPKYGDQMMFREVKKKFNITIDWVTATGSDLAAQLGLIVASGDLPDIIGRIGSTQSAQEYGVQGAYLSLENLIAKSAPNLTAAMKENPAYRGQTVAPDGHMYFFPRLIEPLPRAFPGYQIRRDWLDKLGLSMPDTMAELETVLKAFRDKDPNGNGKADEIPWSSDPRVLIWPFGIGAKGYNNTTDMFVENKTIRYGPTDPRLKDALTLLSRWYADKLIDNEYLGMSGTQFSTRVLQDRVGAILGSYFGYLTVFNKQFATQGKPGRFVALPPPTGPTGIRSMMGSHAELDPACGAAITVKSKYPEQITKLLDYFYGTEGQRLLFFGMEGDTYNMEGGNPAYTDKVTKHPTLAIADYVNTYVGYVSVWASICPSIWQLQIYEKEGKDAIQVSAKYMGNRKIPVLQFTQEEIKEVQTLSRDVDTFVDEWTHAFIRGQKPISDWSVFQDGLKKLNTERLTVLYQTAYARYQKVAGL